MNRIISRNPIQRFKDGQSIKKRIPFFRRGYRINNSEEGKRVQELQKMLVSKDFNIKVDGWFGPKTKAAWDEYTKQVKGNINNFFNYTENTVGKSRNNVSKQITTSKELLAAKQEALWNAGAFKDVIDKRTGKPVTYERAVDGINGPMTKQAIANSQKIFNKLALIGGNPQTTKKSNSKLANALVGAAEKTHSVVKDFHETRAKKGSENISFPAAAIKASIPLIPLPGMGLVRLGYNLGNTINNKKNEKLHIITSNAYPYSYGDILVNGTDTIPYSWTDYPNGIPEGYKLTQTTNKTSKPLQVESMSKKIEGALQGKDPRRAYIEQMAAIDLNTPEGIKQWDEMVRNKPEGVMRISGNRVNDQFELRARLAAAYAYDNNGQQIPDSLQDRIKPIFEYNPDYESPTAKSRGKITYRIADPKQRERIYGEMKNYFLKHKNEGTWNKDHTAFILPSLGYLGNHSLIADDENGLNLRYGDWWDYKMDPDDAYIMYMGDRLVPEGTYPKKYASGQVGHNAPEMTEVFDGNYVKELLLNKLNKVIN